MMGVRVQIVRWVDDYQPGIIECHLTDAHGHIWSFIEKLPIVTEERLDENSTYPRPGVIACEVIGKESDITRIDTSRPWQVESEEGQTQFEVSAASLIEFDWSRQ